MMRLSLALLFLFELSCAVHGQVTPKDSLPTPTFRSDSIIGFRELQEPEAVNSLEMQAPGHNPNNAALYSAILPGLGQAYNKKYWKIPIVWAGIGTFIYFIDWNNKEYQFYRRNLIYEVEGNPDFENETPFDETVLKSARDQYRRNRDQLIIFGIMFYLLNIVDAHVDAHLIEFDVNQDLSLQLQPSSQKLSMGNHSTGMSLTLKF